jgi:hypothetical protein
MLKPEEKEVASQHPVCKVNISIIDQKGDVEDVCIRFKLKRLPLNGEEDYGQVEKIFTAVFTMFYYLGDPYMGGFDEDLFRVLVKEQMENYLEDPDNLEVWDIWDPKNPEPLVAETEGELWV